MKVYASLRQWVFPPPFRIVLPIWPPDIREALAELAEALGQAGQGTAAADGLSQARQEGQEAIPATAPDAPEIAPRVLADVSTGLWRLQHKMGAITNGDAARDWRRASRHLEAVQDALTQAGIEVVDHTHEPYVAGMALKVIAFQPAAGMQREQVLETIKPTVYLNGRAIQTGEVIVATPAANQGDVEHETGND